MRKWIKQGLKERIKGQRTEEVKQGEMDERKKERKGNKENIMEGTKHFYHFFPPSLPLDVEIGSNLRNCPCLGMLMTSSTTEGTSFARWSNN